ncbi:hypothetical protein OIU84_026023 [Salix udensis]|uniref:Uncharacterized protein n=1 Tax=Salix udensis TaxID=889485 RepID=A0AAD6KKY5_9ROSI|nr:hypothetical protein OIU84_026023 [Salix udensis]
MRSKAKGLRAERGYERECVGEPEREARDERVMCLVWGRGLLGCREREVRGPRGEVRDEGTRETHEEKSGRDESRVQRERERRRGDRGWRGRRDEGLVVVTQGESEGKRKRRE